MKPNEKLHVLKTRANKLYDKFDKLGKRMGKYETESAMSQKEDDEDLLSESSKGEISSDEDGYWLDGGGDD